MSTDEYATCTKMRSRKNIQNVLKVDGLDPIIRSTLEWVLRENDRTLDHMNKEAYDLRVMDNGRIEMCDRIHNFMQGDRQLDLHVIMRDILNAVLGTPIEGRTLDRINTDLHESGSYPVVMRCQTNDVDLANLYISLCDHLSMFCRFIEMETYENTDPITDLQDLRSSLHHHMSEFACDLATVCAMMKRK